MDLVELRDVKDTSSLTGRIEKCKNIFSLKSDAFCIARAGILHVFRLPHLFQGESDNNGKMSELQWHPSRYSISSRDQPNRIVIRETPDCIRIAYYMVNADTCKHWGARSTCAEWKCTCTHILIHGVWKWCGGKLLYALCTWQIQKMDDIGKNCCNQTREETRKFSVVSLHYYLHP